MRRPIDMESKECESSIHDHDIDHGRVDSDQGHFRRRRAVDIPSLFITNNTLK